MLTEIERIIGSFTLFLYESNDEENGRPVTIDDYCPQGTSKEIAKVISQYVIKARISELKKFLNTYNPSAPSIKNTRDIVSIRIAELKKGLEPCLCYHDQFNSECPQHNSRKD